MNNDTITDTITNISDKIESQHSSGRNYYLIELASGRKCYYEEDDAVEFQIGDEVKGVINERNYGNTIYPKTLENISFIKRKGIDELNEILKNTKINE